MAYRYRTVKIDGKTKLLHRHVMEQHLGRPLLRSEQVHHRNGDRYDNRIGNLELLSVKEHMHHHKQKYAETKTCAICGSPFTPHPTKRKRAETCSKPCASKLRWARRKGERPDVAAAIIRANVQRAGAGERAA